MSPFYYLAFALVHYVTPLIGFFSKYRSRAYRPAPDDLISRFIGYRTHSIVPTVIRPVFRTLDTLGVLRDRAASPGLTRAFRETSRPFFSALESDSMDAAFEQVRVLFEGLTQGDDSRVVESAYGIGAILGSFFSPDEFDEFDAWRSRVESLMILRIEQLHPKPSPALPRSLTMLDPRHPFDPISDSPTGAWTVRLSPSDRIERVLCWAILDHNRSPVRLPNGDAAVSLCL